ncbi:MAG TPA: sensor histidine kinase [Gemmatimonadales bacterium]|nr:sensor histidine kinase [Gemmatimonadales bacterium]
MAADQITVMEDPSEEAKRPVVEQVVRRILEHPFRFPVAAMLIGLGLSLLRHPIDDLPRLLGVCAMFVLWVRLWVGQLKHDPSGRRPFTMVVAIVGSLIMGWMVSIELGLAIVPLAMMPQYFITLPFPLAIVCGFPAAIGSEWSHRLGVLQNPDAFPWMLAFVRAAAFLVIGVSFKLLRLQMNDLARLQANLASAERKAGVLEERQRLAREIHDTLAQGFASIIVHLERTEQINHLEHSPAKGHIDLARSVAREGLEESRRMMAALRPEVLEQRGLPEALGRVCQEWSRRTGIESKLSVTGTAEPLHPEIELTILRGVQEGLTNVARHSGAHTTAVTLSYMEDLVVLDVQDDGKGFVPSEAGRTGYGLHGMRERVEGLQGSLQVESVLGEGTTISLTLPVLRPAAGEAHAETSAA